MSQSNDMVVLTEINKKLEKFYKVHYLTFFPTWKDAPLSSKFYARHEGEDGMELYEDMLKMQMGRFLAIKDKAKVETVNQEYGLCREPILLLDRNDRRFYHSRIGCELTKVEALIRQSKGEVN